MRASLGLLAQKAGDAIIFLSALVASLYLERSRFLISVLLSFPHFVLSCVGSVDYKISVSLFLVFFFAHKRFLLHKRLDKCDWTNATGLTSCAGE